MKFCIVFCLLSGFQVLMAAPRGVVFYRPFAGAGDSVTIVSEYSSLRLFPVIVNFVPFPHGAREKGIERDRYIGFVEYPDLNRDSIVTQEDKELFYLAVTGLQSALKTYPNAKKMIGGRVDEMTAASALLRQGNILVEGKWRPQGDPPPGGQMAVDLVVGGRTYRKARLLSVANGKAQVGHTDGVLGVDVASLSPDQVAALRSTSPSVKFGPSDHPATSAPGDPILRSNQVRSILTPLVRSAGPSPHNDWGRDVRVEVGHAARQTVKDLRTLAATSPPSDADALRTLADQIAFPFEMSATKLGGKEAAETALSVAIQEKATLESKPFEGGHPKIRIDNAQRKIDQARAHLAGFDLIKTDVAQQLKATDLAIARYLEAGDREPAQALAVSLYSLRDFQGLRLPFNPSVSRIWTTMSSLDALTASQIKEQAMKRVVKWAAFNWGAEQIEYLAWKEMLQAGQADDPLAHFFQMLIVAGISSAAQDAAVQEIEQNLEVAFFEDDADARSIRMILEHFLSGQTSGVTFTQAAVEQTVTQINPALGRKAKVVMNIHSLLRDAHAVYHARAGQQ